MSYPQVWLLVFVSALACLAFFFLLTRRIGNKLVRMVLRSLAAVFLLAPAPLPEYPGFYAPAFIVALFEGVFRDQGQPQLALSILGYGGLAVLIALILWYLLAGRKQPAETAPRGANSV